MQNSANKSDSNKHYRSFTMAMASSTSLIVTNGRTGPNIYRRSIKVRNLTFALYADTQSNHQKTVTAMCNWKARSELDTWVHQMPPSLYFYCHMLS